MTLTDDEKAFLLQLLGSVQVSPLAPGAAATVRSVQGLAKKLQPPRAKPKKRGK